MARWVFVRHGESAANASRVLSGWTDVPLTDRGRSQARRAGHLLAEHSPPPLRVVSSDLQRAHETAQIAMSVWAAAHGVPRPAIAIHDQLRERNMGVLQGVSIQQARQDGRMKLMLGWQSAPEGGESLAALARRCLDAVSTLNPEESWVIFAHGGVIRVLSGMLDHLHVEQIASRKVENAKPIIRHVEHGLWGSLRARYAL